MNLLITADRPPLENQEISGMFIINNSDMKTKFRIEN